MSNQPYPAPETSPSASPSIEHSALQTLPESGPASIATPSPPPAEQRWRMAAGGLLGAAAVISLYLAWQSATGNAVAGCTAESGCGQVMASRWGFIAGVPVSLPGAAAYAALLVLAWRRGSPSLLHRRLECALTVLVAGAAVWFTVVQLFILRAFCPWCSAVHGMAVAGALLLWLSRRRSANAATPRTGIAAIILPAAALAGFVIMQTTSTEPERIHRQTVEQAVAGADGKLSLHGGRILLDTAALPVIGVPGTDAPAVALTDFTCPHCRELHRTLTQLAADRPGRFSTVLLPGAIGAEAREVHRIMLTLWRAEPEQYRQLSEELIAGGVEPKAASLLADVQQRTGGKFYELAWTHGAWVQEIMRQGEELMALNGRVSKTATLPQLMLRDQVLTGAPKAETLAALADAAPGAPATVASVPGAPPASAANAAVIAFDGTDVDMGTVTKGEIATKKITFTNSGKEPLTLSAVKAGCGCTTVDGWQQTVAPGAQGAFELKFDSGKFFGQVTKPLSIESNAANGSVTLNLTINVWCPAVINPPTASFGSILKGTKPEPRRIKITAFESETLKPGTVTCTNSAFVPELKVIEEGKDYELIVSMPEMGDRAQNGEIVLPLDHPKFKEVRLTAFINPVDPLMVQPPQLNLAASSLKAGSIVPITVFLHDPDVPSLEVTDLKWTGSSDVVVTFDRQGSNRWGRVQLAFPAGFEAGETKDAVVSFNTNHPRFPQFTVPVHFIGAANGGK